MQVFGNQNQNCSGTSEQRISKKQKYPKFIQTMQLEWQISQEIASCVEEEELIVESFTLVHLTGPNSTGMCSGGRQWGSNATYCLQKDFKISDILWKVFDNTMWVSTISYNQATNIGKIGNACCPPWWTSLK